MARPREVVAQTARDLVTQGVRAYRALEYDAAVALLRRSLAEGALGTLSTAERAQALTYLGATELFRGRRDSASLAFADVVLLDPRYRPDELIFPPQVTNLFQQVRQATRPSRSRCRPSPSCARGAIASRPACSRALSRTWRS